MKIVITNDDGMDAPGLAALGGACASLGEVFAVAPGEVTALSGVWRDQIFAISRWPTRAAAEDFWFCDRYQTQAIPLRVGYGRFDVNLLDAA